MRIREYTTMNNNSSCLFLQLQQSENRVQQLEEKTRPTPPVMVRYLTNRFHFCVRLYCNRSQRRSRMRDFLFFTRYGVICDLLQYRSTKK